MSKTNTGRISSFIGSAAAVCCASLGLLFSSPHAAAATIDQAHGAECELSVSGEIEQGDFDRFVDRARELRVTTVCLAGPGGSWADGLKIAEYIKDHFVGTYVREGQECFSACAVIFLAGARKGRLVQGIVSSGINLLDPDPVRLPNRKMHIGAKIGFHAPYVSLPERQYSARELELARVAAFQSFAKLLAIMSKTGGVKNHINYIPKRFISRAMRTAKDDFLLIDSVDMAGWLRIDLVGYRVPNSLSDKDLFWAATKDLVWAEDKSFFEWMHEVREYYSKPTYEKIAVHENNSYRRVFFVECFTCGEGDWEVFCEIYKSGNSTFYCGVHSFGRYEEINGRWVEVTTQEHDRQLVLGISKKLIDAGHRYLLMPVWYSFPAQTKFSEMAVE